MAQTSRSLFGYTNISSHAPPGNQGSRSLFEFTNISSAALAADLSARALYGFTNVAGDPGDQVSRSLYAYTAIDSFTDLNDPLQVDLLSAALEVEHILRVK